MAMESDQRASMNLVLSTDAKPRLKWTSELHHMFVEAVCQLGGPEKATPKGLMKVMGIPGLTLYHLKSHLQKYRLGKSQQPDGSCVVDNKQEVASSSEEERLVQSSGNDHENVKGSEIHDESKQMADALQMQMEVQKKLHEQIEVQRHLQVRIEAQGKYLQSVLEKARETLAGYTSSNLGLDFARAELSKLASMVNRGCPSSSFSDITEAEGEGERGFLDHKKPENAGSQTRCSAESSMTSSESTDTKSDNYEIVTRRSIELPLMETKPEALNRKKRTLNDDAHVEQPPRGKRAFEGEHLRLSLS
ncbi:PREDICTED: myb family transcription factor PHL8 isoform X2 [Tarenaya hassleriana]|uniref:myb family transcription factor PHL8 isoform X2 n=1 Tax=Tarenaya hassleriana TaxID=28532 RepID=UPI00053C78E7|nr:PREDICTED: myb family transcription factor PHL8 isoform X2 [Tarenaya hassleriana]